LLGIGFYKFFKIEKDIADKKNSSINENISNIDNSEIIKMLIDTDFNYNNYIKNFKKNNYENTERKKIVEISKEEFSEFEKINEFKDLNSILPINPDKPENADLNFINLLM
jgi:hypothetical protein